MGPNYIVYVQGGRQQALLVQYRQCRTTWCGFFFLMWSRACNTLWALANAILNYDSLVINGTTSTTCRGCPKLGITVSTYIMPVVVGTSGKESIAYSYLLYLFSLFHFTQSLIKQSNYTKEKQCVESRASPKSIKFCIVIVRELKCYVLRVELMTTCSYQKR